MKRKTLALPVDGLSLSSARTKQRMRTTPHAENVRGYDLRAKRVRMSKRAGLVSLLNEPIRGGIFNSAQPLRFLDYGQYFEPIDDLAMLDPDDYELVSRFQLLARAIDIAVDVDQFVYVLDATGRVVVLDSEMRQTGYIPSQVPYGLAPLPRVLIGADKSIYLGATGTVLHEGASSYIYRIASPIIDGDRPSLAWKHPIRGELVDMSLKAATITYLYNPEDQEIPSTRIAYLGALESGLPVDYVDVRTTRGAWAIEQNRFGDAIIAAPRLENRSSSTLGFPLVSWTPREIADWEDNMFSWIDANQVQEGDFWTDGAPISIIKDARHFENDSEVVTNDTIERNLGKTLGIHGNSRPTWKADAFGQAPGFVIPRTGHLSTAQSTGATLDEQENLTPGSAAADRWNFFMLVQLLPRPVNNVTAAVQRVYTQYDATGGYFFSIEVTDADITFRGGETAAPSAPVIAAATDVGPDTIAIIRLDYLDGTGIQCWINGISIGTLGFLSPFDSNGPFTAFGSTHQGPTSIFSGNTAFDSTPIVTDFDPFTGGNSQGSSYFVLYTSNGPDIDFQAATVVGGFEVDFRSHGGPAGTGTDAFEIGFYIGSPSVLQYTERFTSAVPFEGLHRFMMDRPVNADRIVIESRSFIGNVSRANSFKIFPSVDSRTISAVGELRLSEAICFANDTNMLVAYVGNGANATDAQRIEGYLAHKVGGSDFLDPAHPFYAFPPTGVGDPNMQPALVAAMGSDDAQIAKHDSAGRVVAVLTETRLRNGGIGYGLAIDDEGSIYTVGAPLTPGPGPAFKGPAFTKLIDAGFQFTLTGGFIQEAPSTEWEEILDAASPIPIVVDGESNTTRSLPSGNLIRNEPDGTLISTRDVGYFPWAFDYPISIPQVGSSPEIGPEFIYEQGDDGLVVKQRIVSRTPSGRLTTRRGVFVAAVGEDLVVFDRVSTLARPAQGVMTSPRPIFSFTAFGEMVLVDGDRIRVVDLAHKTVEDLEAEVGPSPPHDAELAAFWDGRGVFARLKSDPHNYVMSKQDDIRNYDEFPREEDPTRAVSGNSAVSDGRMPSIINAVIPINDVIIVFGCVGAIYRIVGNPASDGRRNTVSSEIGMAYGKSWCRDPNGTLYIMSDQGGIYVMGSQVESVPFGGPQSITLNSVHGEMLELDFSKFRVHMEWSEALYGMHVFLIPLDQDDRVSKPRHYFYEIAIDGEKRAGFWRDTFASHAHQISSACVVSDDSPDMRGVVVGCRDGNLRMFDPLSPTDDGEPIHSTFEVGPFPGDGEDFRHAFQGFAALLATDGGHATVRMYAGDGDSRPPGAAAEIVVHPGVYTRSLARAQGMSAWFEFLLQGKFTAVEAAAVDHMPVQTLR
jgi:hypothetical protein